MTQRGAPEVDIGSQYGEDRPDLAGPDAAGEFSRLFDTYADQLYRYLSRRVGADTAHDLVSDTFLAAFRQRRRYDPQAAVVRAWLYGIATNLARRHARQEVRALRALAKADSRAGVTQAGHDGRMADQVADRVDAQAMARQLAPALADLSDGDRDVLLLTSWAELSTSEVAEALGIPVGTVRSRLHRVRQKLRATAPLNSPTGGEER